MIWKILAAVVLAGFLALTGVVLAEVGYLGFFEVIGAHPATRLLSWDLVICLTLISIWMYRDARARGSNAIPYIVVAALFGAAGPLAYLIGRKEGERPL